MFSNFSNITQQTSHVPYSYSLYNSFPLIFYSGGTHQITCSLKNFQVFSKIKSINNHLPDDSIVTSYYFGIVHFAHSFIIYNVFCVHDFIFNLFSISKTLSSLI